MNPTAPKTENQCLEHVRKNNKTYAIGVAKDFKDLDPLELNNAPRKEIKKSTDTLICNNTPL